MIRLLDVYDGTGIRPHALDFLYLMLQQRVPEHSISHRELPSFEAHRQFVTRRPYAHWFLIETTEIPCWIGNIYLTQHYEIGIFITNDAQGRGYGPAAIRRLMELYPVHGTRPWLANIAPANERSKRTFERLGFRKISETYAYYEEEHHGKDETAGKA